MATVLDSHADGFGLAINAEGFTDLFSSRQTEQVRVANARLPLRKQTLPNRLWNLPQISFFLRNSIGRRRNQLKTEGVRLPGKVFKKPISVLLFVSFLTDVDVLASQLDHAVDQKCEFVGDRGNTFRYA